MLGICHPASKRLGQLPGEATMYILTEEGELQTAVTSSAAVL